MLDTCDEHFLFYAEGRFFKLYVDICAQILALSRSVWVFAAAAAAEAENVAEYIAEAAEITEAAEIAKAAEAALSAAKALTRVKGGMAETIVLCALISIGEDFVSLIYLFKPRLALFVAGMKIGVILFGKLSVCFFELILGRVLGYAENLIIISFFRHKATSFFNAQYGRTVCAHMI